MSSLEYANGSVTLEIQYDGVSLMLTDALIRDFVTHLLAFAQRVNLASLSLEKSDGDSNHFAYHFESKDGRHWDQTMIIDSDDPLMDFTVGSRWKLSEFTLQRPVRDEAIQLVRRYGVTKIEAVFP